MSSSEWSVAIGSLVIILYNMTNIASTFCIMLLLCTNYSDILFQSPKKNNFVMEPVTQSMTSYETMKQETKKSAALYTLVCIVVSFYRHQFYMFVCLLSHTEKGDGW